METWKTQLAGGEWTVCALAEGIYRVILRRDARQRESMLTRYGIVQTDLGAVEATRLENGLRAGESRVEVEDGRAVFHSRGYSLVLDASATFQERYRYGGFCLRIPLDEDERLFGLGDETRDALMKRGREADLWQANVTSYGPVPYVMSAKGWSILLNVTYRHHYDLGKTDPDALRVESAQGMLDAYVFLGASMKDALDKYTRVSGRPVLLPKAAYGLTFVNNEEEGARDLLQNCLMFRREKIPCDIMGLEPGWMSKHYDFSVDKKWDDTRFYRPYWMPENYSGSGTFFYNLRQMGYKLSLWLCCDYDLLWQEESECRERRAADGALAADAEIVDEHLSGALYMDKLTKPGEGWFEHLKKFVDNGAAAFKLDGANQVLEHPDRLFAGRYTDDEVHNVYPVVYGKQMKEGFQKYTGRRAMIYTPCMYAGQQQYCATWAGDTGGGYKTMVSIQNLAMCGHSNASCDMDVTQLSSIHYCALMPWMQHLGWRNWQDPWFLGDELEGIYRDYAQLRSSLFPYIYSMAHRANETGLPMARPLTLAYEGDAKWDHVLHEYMFGDSILVTAFDSTIQLPPGRWTDYFTGQTYEGQEPFVYDPPRGKGGAMLVKDGGIVVTQPWMPHLTHHDPLEYVVNVYLGADGAFTLYEDDGETYAYERGEVATTQFALQGDALSIGMRKGSYTRQHGSRQKEDNGVVLEERRVCQGMASLAPFYVRLHNAQKGAAVTLNGQEVESEWQDGCLCFVAPVSLHERQDLTYRIVQENA